MDALIPIGDVAARFDLPMSTLHYWERCGLITPHRRHRWRYYDRDQLYRIALIRLWRETAQMTIEQIATILAGRTAAHDWRETVLDQLDAIDVRLAELGQAKDYLSHLLDCPLDDSLETCQAFRKLVAVPRASSE